MANVSSLVGDLEVNYDPRILIRKAHAATSSTGSATAILAVQERNGTMKVAGVGDCGLRVICRGAESLFEALSDRSVLLLRLTAKSSLEKSVCLQLLHEFKGFDVPFWKKILGMKLTGGKLDDITVIVGQVVTSAVAATVNQVQMTGKMEEAGSGDTRGLL